MWTPSQKASVFSQEDLFVPGRIEMGWLVLLYLVAVLVPFAGIPLGLLMFIGKKTLKDGTKIPLFDKWTLEPGLDIGRCGRTKDLSIFFLPLVAVQAAATYFNFRQPYFIIDAGNDDGHRGFIFCRIAGRPSSPHLPRYLRSER